MSESKLLVEGRKVVVPGDVIATGMEYLPSHGTYRKDENIIANRIGVLSVEGKVIKTIPLAGTYLPKRGDTIIGTVSDILMSGWRLNINCPYEAVLPMKDGSNDFIPRGANLSKYYDIEDNVVCKVVNVTSQKLIDVSCRGPGLRKLNGGLIIHINAHKVPRVIGKKGSMVSMIKNATGCRIIVGQNGRIWISGDPDQERIAIAAIQKIGRESHTPGLTDTIKHFLEQETGHPVEVPTGDERQEDDEHDNEGRGDGRRDDRRNNRQDNNRRDNRGRDGNRRNFRRPRND